MKRLGKDLLASALMGLILPGMFLNFAVAVQEETVVTETEPTTVPMQTLAEEQGISVMVMGLEETLTEMDLEAYLVGVVLAEMPASFEKEALKAQSVVARTYAGKTSVTSGKHGDGSVCVNPSCCQGYLSQEAYLAAGGTEENIGKIRDAVASTAGQVLTYKGDLIEATYFSCSGGSTEAAVAVWGTDYPYLQSVDSPGEEQAAYYTDEIHFSREELEKRLGISLVGTSDQWFQTISFTDGGGVDTAEIGGSVFRGTELRTILGLRSTAFVVQGEENAVRITTRGYGHRVGMSQYGADAMAAEGSSYPQILAHYYSGTQLTDMSSMVRTD